ncbi:MAG: hypothetical protein U5R31_16125 [Acidimicrobiia bacterium]|nr:hypothetical protein [Acidimicrobiia bacterium]
MVTLVNEGGGDVEFVVALDGEPVGDPVTVGEASDAEVVVPFAEDQVGSVTVTAPGFGVVVEQEIDFDCEQPVADIDLSCDAGGAVVTLTNGGELPVDLDVVVDGEGFVTETVGTDPVEVLVPLEEDQVVKIGVLDGDEVIESAELVFDCEAAPSEGEVVPPGDVPPAEVLPASLERGPAGSLPVTGRGLGLAVVGLALLLAGTAALAVRRRAAA